MNVKKTLISIATAAAVIAGGSLAIAQTTGTQGSANDPSSAQQGTGTGTGTTGQTDSMNRTGTQSARTDRN